MTYHHTTRPSNAHAADSARVIVNALRLMPDVMPTEVGCSPRPYIVHTWATDDLRFEWDPAKAKLNVRKHQVAFEEAQTAFSDERAQIIDDPEQVEDETRLVLLGMSVALLQTRASRTRH